MHNGCEIEMRGRQRGRRPALRVGGEQGLAELLDGAVLLEVRDRPAARTSRRFVPSRLIAITGRCALSRRTSRTPSASRGSRASTSATSTDPWPGRGPARRPVSLTGEARRRVERAREPRPHPRVVVDDEDPRRPGCRPQRRRPRGGGNPAAGGGGPGGGGQQPAEHHREGHEHEGGGPGVGTGDGCSREKRPMVAAPEPCRPLGEQDAAADDRDPQAGEGGAPVTTGGRP